MHVRAQVCTSNDSSTYKSLTHYANTRICIAYTHAKSHAYSVWRTEIHLFFYNILIKRCAFGANSPALRRYFFFILLCQSKACIYLSTVSQVYFQALCTSLILFRHITWAVEPMNWSFNIFSVKSYDLLNERI